MLRLRALLWRRPLSLPQLDTSASCLHSTNPLLGSCTAWVSQSISAQLLWQQQQPYSGSSCTGEEGENLVRQQRQTAKSATVHDHDVSAWEFESMEAIQALKRPHSSDGRSALRPAPWMLVDELKAKGTSQEGRNLVRQPHRTAKSAASHGHSRPAACRFEETPRATALKHQSRDGTQPPKQLEFSEDRSPTRPSRSMYIPVEELKALDTCEGVWDKLCNIPPEKITVPILSAALDHMVAISKRPGYQQTF